MAKQTAASTSKSATEGSATEGKAGVFGKIKSAWSTTTDFVASTKQKVKNELASRRGESHPDPRLPKQKGMLFDDQRW